MFSILKLKVKMKTFEFQWWMTIALPSYYVPYSTWYFYSLEQSVQISVLQKQVVCGVNVQNVCAMCGLDIMTAEGFITSLKVRMYFNWIMAWQCVHQLYLHVVATVLYGYCGNVRSALILIVHTDKVWCGHKCGESPVATSQKCHDGSCWPCSLCRTLVTLSIAPVFWEQDSGAVPQSALLYYTTRTVT